MEKYAGHTEMEEVYKWITVNGGRCLAIIESAFLFRYSCVKPPTGLPDKRVGRFQCLSKIGQGSYGNVFKCRDRETDTVVAIKRFLQTEDNANIRKIAYREIRILKVIDTPKQDIFFSNGSALQLLSNNISDYYIV
jgi:Protein kinase domain